MRLTIIHDREVAGLDIYNSGKLSDGKGMVQSKRRSPRMGTRWSIAMALDINSRPHTERSTFWRIGFGHFSIECARRKRNGES